MKKILYISAFLAFSLDVSAMSLMEGLEKAYETNPQIKSNQQEYISNLQRFPEAISGFLPSVMIGIQDTNTKQKASNTQNNKNEFSKSLKVTQNIFAGGRSAANLGIAKYAVESAKFKYLLAEQEFIIKAIQVYVQYIAAKERYDASKNFVASSQKEFEATNEKLKVGEATKTEVASAKAQHSKALAQNARNNQEMLSKKSEFRAFFGEEPNDDIKMPEIPSDLPQTFEDFKEKSMSQNLSLNLLRANQTIAKYTLRAEQGSLLPRVNAQAETGQLYNSGDNTFDRKSKARTYSTTISLDIPIFESGGAEYSRIRRSKSDLRKVVYDVEKQKNDIETNIITRWESYIASIKTVQFSKEAAEAQQMAYEGMSARYDVGIASIIDLLKSENDLYDAKVASIESNSQAVISSYALLMEMSKLTSKELGLKIKSFDPDSEFKKVKFKVLGF